MPARHAVAADAAPTTAAAAAAASTRPRLKARRASHCAPAQNAVRGSEIGVRRLVCLNMSLQCFAITAEVRRRAQRRSGVAGPESAGHPPRGVAKSSCRQRLDEPYELRKQQEQVQVEGTRPDVYVPVGIASLPWAVMHPTQAWRIFLPVPPGAGEIAASANDAALDARARPSRKSPARIR